MVIERHETQNPNLLIRIQDAIRHVARFGYLQGETRREAVISLAGLNPLEEDLADTMGLLPPDPV